MMFFVPHICTFYRLLIGLWMCVDANAMHHRWGMVLLLFAAFSDFLDGFFARLLQQESAFGRLFDPLADAFFLVGAMVNLAYQGVLPLTFLLLGAVRYGCCLLYYFDMSRFGYRHKALWIGKSFACMAMLLACVEFFCVHFQNGISHFFLYALRALVVLLYGWSWLSYYRRYFRCMQHQICAVGTVEYK